MEAFGPLPPGRVAAFRPPAGADLSALGVDVHAIHGFRPDHDRLAAEGFETSAAPEGEYAAAAVFLPRSREAGRDLIARAMAMLPPRRAGARGRGEDRRGRRRAALGAQARGGHLGSGVQGAWQGVHGARRPAARELPRARAGGRRGWSRRRGGSPAGRVDPGSRLLAEALPALLPGHVVDLGAGWGWLAARALAREGVERIDLVEAEHARARGGPRQRRGPARRVPLGRRAGVDAGGARGPGRREPALPRGAPRRSVARDRLRPGGGAGTGAARRAPDGRQPAPPLRSRARRGVPSP